MNKDGNLIAIETIENIYDTIINPEEIAIQDEQK